MPKGVFKRKPFSDKHRRNLALAKIGRKGNHTGKPHTEDAKRKMSEKLKGKKKPPRTLEHRVNLSKSGRGRKMPPVTLEWRKKNADRQRGERSRFWKGGITKEHRLIRTTLEYRLWREAVYKRDNFTCVLCGKRGVRLNADHIKSFASYPELRFDVSNGRTLCEPCHRKTDTFGRPKLSTPKALCE